MENPTQGGRLPPELISLIHHAELHRSGWWDRALDRIVLVTVWLRAPTTVDDVLATLNNSLEGRLDRERVERDVERALAAGVVVETADGKLKTSEEQHEALTLELRSVTESEKRVWGRLVELAEQVGIRAIPEMLWEDFEDLFMQPLVRAAGARVYEVLTSSVDIASALPSFREIVRPLCDKYGGEARQLLIDFLDPTNLDVRNYVLRTLNGNFLREAAGLDIDHLEALRHGSRPSTKIDVLVDTNFLFSFLRLHDNPSNEVAEDLIQLIERAKESVTVELCILPITAEETRRTLRDVMSRLSGIIPRRNLAQAAREFTSTGLVTRYLEAAGKDLTGSLTPELFFGPYESDLTTILRQQGVTVLDVDLDELRVDQRVIDDLHDQEEVQRQSRRRGAKPYEANLHDMVLWHYVDRNRPSGGDSALDLGMWACTVDFGLIAFDRRKRRGTEKAPVCVTPSTLIQLLQFWVPRSEELDRALVGAIREPLLFLDFDRSTEQATIRILRTLSRFEGVDDLSIPTMYGVLTNDALRARLVASPDATAVEEAALVEAAIVDETHKLEEKVQQLGAAAEQSQRQADTHARSLLSREQEVEALRERLAEGERDVSRMTQELESLKRVHSDELERAKSHDEDIHAVQSVLAKRIEDLEEAAASSELRARDRRVVVLAAAISGVVLAVGAIILARGLEGQVVGGRWVSIGAVTAGALLGFLLICDLAVRTRQSMRDGALHRILVRSRNGLVALLVATITGVLGSAIWESMR